MAPKCSICHHTDLKKIDSAIIKGIPIRIIADQYNVSLGAINRHKSHIATKIKTAENIAIVNEIHEGIDLYKERIELINLAKENVKKAKSEGTIQDCNGALRVLDLTLTGQERLTGEIKTPQITVNNAIQINIEEEVRKLAHLIRRSSNSQLPANCSIQ